MLDVITMSEFAYPMNRLKNMDDFEQELSF